MSSVTKHGAISVHSTSTLAAAAPLAFISAMRSARTRAPDASIAAGGRGRKAIGNSTSSGEHAVA
eukprot:660579-Prymnesium_polylepis.1